MAYNKAQVTDAGNALFAQILANKSSLSIDKIEISNVQLAASTVITSMTKIDNVVQTTSANGLQKSGNSFIISTAVSNASVTADYQAWVFGIWGSDSANGTSTLIEVITTTGTPDTIPAYSGSTPVTYNYKFATALSNASSINLSMSNDAYATNDTVLHTSGDETSTGTKTFEKIEVSNDSTPDVVLTDGASISLDNGESKFTPANDSTVVHTTGDETINGQKKFDTDPTDGAGNAYAKTVDVNQQLDKKVVDNKNGTEQLNGVQVQPFNKLSDTIGGRNLIVAKTIENNTTLAQGTTFFNSPSFTTDYIPVVANQKYTVTIYDTTISCVSRVAYYDSSKNFISRETDRNISTSSSEVIVIPSGASYIKFSPDSPDGSGKYEDNYKFEQGSVATDWTPAPEDKVNVSDMRKPASDVLGLEDIKSSALPNGTDFYTLINTSGQPQSYHVPDYVSAQTMVNKPTAGLSAFKLNTASIGDGTGPNYNYTFLTLKDESDGSIYEAFLTTDGSGAITVQRPWYKVADDSKVAHLSGANNFDTVPTVDDSPLLLASSLPSDLARTSQQTNFTAGLQSGGVDVATAADLKSVEASAWRQLDNKYIVPASGYTLSPATTILYKIDDSIHKLYLSGTIALDGSANSISVTVQLGSIIKSMLTCSVPYLGFSGEDAGAWFFVFADPSSPTDLTFVSVNGVLSIASTSETQRKLAFVTYDKLV